VTVDGQHISSIGKGLLVLAAIGKDDTVKEAESMAAKILKVKLWDDDQGGRWKKNVQEIEGEVLCGKCAICDFSPSFSNFFPLQSRNSLFSLLPRKETSLIFINPPTPSKEKNCTKPSSPKFASSTVRIG
jgi:hypothetical protein